MTEYRDSTVDKILDANAIGLSLPSGQICAKTEPIPFSDASHDSLKVRSVYSSRTAAIFAAAQTLRASKYLIFTVYSTALQTRRLLPPYDSYSGQRTRRL